MFPRMHLLYTKLSGKHYEKMATGGKDRPCIFIQMPILLVEGSSVESGHAEFADVTDNPTYPWPYNVSF